MMILLSICAMGPAAYGICLFDPSNFVPMILFYALVLWSFECMAQLFAVQFANPLM